MTPEEAIQVTDEVLLAYAGKPLTDIQRLILRESLAGKGYERMEGYAPQHIKNQGKKLWDLLSKALGQKVSKTSFRGALEKRWKEGELIPKPPLLSIYNPQTWVGRKAIIDECLPRLQRQARVLWITGISGIGKTALGECLASQSWEGDPSFQWLYLEILEGQSQEFVSVAADLLAKLGEIDLDPQERNDPKQLMERLLRKLKVSRYWLQVDSLERLLNSEQPTETEFADHHWVTFFQRCLTEPTFASRLVLTAQALPSSLAELEDRYPNLWQVITLQGLLANQPDDQQPNENLELFDKNGLSVDDSSSSHLQRIGQIYEGHPLVLQVIAKEVLALPFAGNVATYWERYGNEFEQVARELQAEWVEPELYNQALQRRVRRRVKLSLKRLPTEALDLLCRSSVYRRPVPEAFWLSMLEEQTSQRRQQAYQILNERAFVEREGIHQNQFLIRQHNLVRAVAYDLLKADTQMWHQSERQAAHLWLTAYELAPDAPNLETVRGYLEAFEHYCEVGDWEAAKAILMTELNTPTRDTVHWQLGVWGYRREQIPLCHRILGKLDARSDRTWLNALGVAYRSLGDYQRAINYHQQTLVISREIGDRQNESTSLAYLGTAYKGLGQYERAINYYQQALVIAQEIGDLLREGDALTSLGIVYGRLRDYQRSIDCSHKVLVISREIGDRQSEGNALGNLGNVYNNLGQYERAINYYQQHLTISRETGDRQGEGADLGNLGAAYHGLGQYEQAINYYQQHLTISREIGARQDEGNALGNLGNTYDSLGQYERAINYAQQSLAIKREIGDRQGEGNTLGNLGNTYDSLGQYERAINFHQQSLAIEREIGDRQGEGNTLGNLGNTYDSLGQYERAIDFYQQALVIARKIGNRRSEGIALGNLGNTYDSLGQYERAINFYQQALVIARKIGNRRSEGIALLNTGATQLKLEQYAECLINNQTALEISREIGDQEGDAEALKNLAELHQVLGEVEVARRYCQQALELATELGIPLVEECQKLKEELEERGSAGGKVGVAETEDESVVSI